MCVCVCVAHCWPSHSLSLKDSQTSTSPEEDAELAAAFREDPRLQLLRKRLTAKRELLSQLNRMYNAFLGDSVYCELLCPHPHPLTHATPSLLVLTPHTTHPPSSHFTPHTAPSFSSLQCTRRTCMHSEPFLPWQLSLQPLADCHSLLLVSPPSSLPLSSTRGEPALEGFLPP